MLRGSIVLPCVISLIACTTEPPPSIDPPTPLANRSSLPAPTTSAVAAAPGAVAAAPSNRRGVVDPHAPPAGESSGAPHAAAPAPSSSTGAPGAGSLPARHFGELFTAQELTLADVMKEPAKYAKEPFTTVGMVTAVCQEMGCWMELKDKATGAHLRMHGHSFFIPKDAAGRRARVQATVIPEGAPKACAGEADCNKQDPSMLQLDATGVELD